MSYDRKKYKQLFLLNNSRVRDSHRFTKKGHIHEVSPFDPKRHINYTCSINMGKIS